MNLQDLSAPFPVSAIHWRAQTVSQNGSALALAFIDARDVMDRLDAVCSPAGWSTYNDETPKGRVFCKLSLLVNGEWVTKTDGAGDTAVEGDKGGISDALKRAAVQWGIGRYLYDIGNVWAPCEFKQDGNRRKFIKWKPEAQQVFDKALRGVRPLGPINDKTRDWLGAQIQASGKTPADLFRMMAPQSLKDITYEQLPQVQALLKTSQKKAA